MEAAQSLQMLSSRQTMGKLLLRPESYGVGTMPGIT
jgi:hypothetical protein